MHAAESEYDYQPIVIVGGICVGLTAIGVVMALCVKITMHYGFVWANTFVQLIISVTLMVFGGILFSLSGGQLFIDKQCQLALDNKVDQM